VGHPQRRRAAARGDRAQQAPAQGVIAHRAPSIERTTHRGIPITTVPRTLVDLASHLSLDALARACHEAGVLYDTTPRQVDDILAKRPKTKGAAHLRAILAGTFT